MAELYNSQVVQHLGPNPQAQEEHIDKQQDHNVPVPDVFHAQEADKRWEKEMLHGRNRWQICVGRNGKDEFVKEPFSEQCYVDLARDIIHRFRPEDEMLPGCSGSDSGIEFQLTPDFTLNVLLLKLKTVARLDDPDTVSTSCIANCPINSQNIILSTLEHATIWLSHRFLGGDPGLTLPSSWLPSGISADLFSFIERKRFDASQLIHGIK
jgi:hypothetical protein